MPNHIEQLKVIKREHVLEALHLAQTMNLEQGRLFSVVFKGRRFDPKALLASAYSVCTGSTANVSEWQDLAYIDFNQVLKDLNFRVVKNPKDAGDTALPVMVYEVKRPAIVQGNYQRLFSPDRARFYWNNNKFFKLRPGDVVFVVNAAAKEVLYTLVESLHISTSYDEQRDLTQFTHSGERYDVKGKWDEFVSLRIRASQRVSDAWQWKTLGSGEHTYFCGPDVAAGSAKNNCERVNLLLEAFTQQLEAEIQLQVCFQVLSALVEEQPITTIEQTEPGIWYVMQGKTFNNEQGKKFLWAPLANEQGRTNKHWTAVADIQIGDVIVHHADGAVRGLSKAIAAPVVAEDPFSEERGWQGKGSKVDIELLVEFKPEIGINVIRLLQKPLAAALAEVRGPYNNVGTGNQGYLFEFTWEALAILLRETNISLPQDILQWLPEVAFDVNANDVPVIEKPDAPTMKTTVDQAEWLPKVQQYIVSKGFDYSLADICNFYLSMRTKPFVLLAGISGTGKTQIIRQFAKALGYGDERHCVLIPVRPDWSDNSDLVGYKNLQGKFEQQKLLRVLQDAAAHPDEPFFVILDEMNLARVEHYFSDFLSVLETREEKDGLIKTDSIVSDPTVNDGVPVTIPQNLMIIGTVNMDETTHPFSRKVLDRANAIEMNEINLPWGEVKLGVVDVISGVYADAFVSPFINSIQLSAEQKSDLKLVIDLLVKINALLEPAGLHFGYRVRDEIAFYLTQFKELNFSSRLELSFDDALDYQLMQKVLPRIQGSSMAVLKSLLLILKELSGEKITADMEFSAVEKILSAQQNHKYPRSVKKLEFMLRRFSEDGFTSFWL